MEIQIGSLGGISWTKQPALMPLLNSSVQPKRFRYGSLVMSGTVEIAGHHRRAVWSDKNKYTAADQILLREERGVGKWKGKYQ